MFNLGFKPFFEEYSEKWNKINKTSNRYLRARIGI
jgi:hypothetical protein